MIVHELAHLVEFNHSKAFNALVDAYPLAERARGFLIAKSLGESDTPESDTAESDTAESNRSDGADATDGSGDGID